MQVNLNSCDESMIIRFAKSCSLSMIDPINVGGEFCINVDRKKQGCSRVSGNLVTVKIYEIESQVNETTYPR
jgi:hypothetical protein